MNCGELTFRGLLKVVTRGRWGSYVKKYRTTTLERVLKYHNMTWREFTCSSTLQSRQGWLCAVDAPQGKATNPHVSGFMVWKALESSDQ